MAPKFDPEPYLFALNWMGKKEWWWLWRKPADLKLATETNGSMFHSKGEWGTHLCVYLQVFLNKYYEDNKWLRLVRRSNMLCHVHSFPKRKQNWWIFHVPWVFFFWRVPFLPSFIELLHFTRRLRSCTKPFSIRSDWGWRLQSCGVLRRFFFFFESK